MGIDSRPKQPFLEHFSKLRCIDLVQFIRKLWLNHLGHAGITVPIEALAYIANGRTEGFDCVITCENNSLIIKPVEDA